MNKLKLIIYVLLCAFLVQSCKKDVVSYTAYTSRAFQAYINELVWAPDTISTTITYDAVKKTKVFYCTATANQQQVALTITLANADSSNGFTTGTFNVDAGTVAIQYYTQQKNQAGDYVFLPAGTVGPGSGTIVITSIDTVKHLITGTFNFYARQINYDGSGNVISITVTNVTGGEFSAIPYTFSQTN